MNTLTEKLPSQGAMTVQEFMAWASVSHTTVYRQIKSRKLRAIRCGRRTLITMDAAKSWLDSLPEMEGAAND